MKLGPCRLQGVVVPQPVSSCRDQTSSTQISEMARCGRLWNLQNLNKIPYAKLPTQKQM